VQEEKKARDQGADCHDVDGMLSSSKKRKSIYPCYVLPYSILILSSPWLHFAFIADEHWINGIRPMPIACPMSVHPQYAAAGRKSWGLSRNKFCHISNSFSNLHPAGINALGSVVVEVEADDGTVGMS
jgi:hypothetical protein